MLDRACPVKEFGLMVQSAHKMSRLLLVDDHAIVRSGLRRLIEDLDCVGDIDEASTGEEALTLARETHYDFVFLDLLLPGISGVETSRRLIKLQPKIAIVILTGRSNPQSARELLNGGVRGYLTKGCSADEMSRAITQVSAGRRYVSEDVQAHWLTEFSDGTTSAEHDSPFEVLTARESEIVNQILGGKRNSQIGKMLFISEKTVSSHRTRAYEKLGVSSTIELAKLAMMHNMLAD